MAQPERTSSSAHPSGLHKFFAFFAWLFTGFGLLGLFRKKSGNGEANELIVYSVHRSFFLWLLILVGFVGGAIVGHAHPGSRLPHLLGWIYIVVLLYTFVVMLFDVSTMEFLIWALVFAFIWVLAKYVEASHHIHLFRGIAAYLKGLRPELNAGFATVMSWLLLGPWISSLVRTFSRGRKSFTPNGIEEWYLGEGSEITDRSGLHFVSRYGDIFKMILGFGSGDLEAMDTSGKVVKRWPNILFLFFTWNRLDQILHERAAVVENTRQEPVEVEDVDKK
jgi:hypothetical protein